MKNRSRISLLVFFLLSYFFPWLIWGTTIWQNDGLLTFHLPQSLAFWIGLNLATLGAATLAGEKAAWQDIGRRMLLWQVPFVWYLIALGLTGFSSLIAMAISGLTGTVPNVGGSAGFANLAGSFLFQVFFFLLTEELAWRGFALPRLQELFNPFTASLILGVVWGIWHLPLFFIPGSFQSGIPFGGFILSAMAMSTLITWIFNHTRGSILIAAIFHASTDLTIAYCGVMTGESRLFWIFVAVQWAAVLLILVRERHSFFTQKVALKTNPFVMRADNE